METLIKKDQFKISRVMYIIEAMLEYFIALGIGTDYLAKLGMEIGMSDSLIAIVEAFVSLGASFRIFAVLLANKTPVKIWVTTLHIISQTFFAIVWFIPLFKFSQTLKTVLLIGFLLIAQILHNLVYPAKTNMYMSCVDDHARGKFTALKEIVSLAGAMVFTNLYGNIIESLQNAGKKELAFILCGALLLFFMLGHSATLIFAKEKVVQKSTQKIKIKDTFKSIFSDKKLLMVILVAVLYNVVNYSSIPFYATYKQSELNLSLIYIPIVAAVGSVVRMICSRPMGKIADKFSFSKMMTVCFLFLAGSYLIMTFTVPSNGKVMYVIYTVLHAIASAGITSGILNLTYDYVSYENRTSALALSGAFSGIVGFVTTLAVTPLVTYIQGNGNKFLGLNVYAQQVLSVISLIILTGLIIYNVFVIGKLKRNDDGENAVSDDKNNEVMIEEESSVA